MRSRDAFSLPEVLAVLAIVSIIAVLAVPAVNSITKSSSLTIAHEQLIGELALARQHAISRNREVEVRFYQYADPNNAPAGAKFLACQIFTYSESGMAEPVGRIKKLPSGIIIDSGTDLSTLAGTSFKKVWGTEPKPSIPDVGTNYDAFVFRFRPDGDTNLEPFPNTPWCITLHDATAGDGLKTPPKNYATIVIDPLNGSLVQYRP